MKFTQLLNEKYFKTVSLIDTFGVKQIIEIFKNPTIQELNQIDKIDDYGGIRLGITDEKNPTVLAWTANVMHKDIKKKIKIGIGFAYDKNIPDFIRMDQYQWEWLKNSESIIKKIKSMFPKVKKVDVLGGDTINI